ncbi:Spore coat protein CotO [Bacillus sp. OV322]|uniref:CotO family spore coat protein n=1 Tax=Bacillus sp. OV322 TaxID=1882764 RepID=UPI0008F1811C|nr:CotO family spore coat protein [Bacillus sp. OV322]SFB98284.1 Spore coat protein CotO [Bacillus sp. OV322]
MADNKKEGASAKPLFYIIQPNITEGPKPNMQQEYRSKNKQKAHPMKEEKKVLEEDAESRKKENEERKLEQVKVEFGVYDAMKEIQDEIEAIKTVKDPKPAGNAEAIKEINAILEKESNMIKRLMSGEEEEKEQPAEALPVYQEERMDPKELKKMKEKINRILKTPKESQKPYCEAVIHGSKIRFQIIGRQDGDVKIKVGSSVHVVSLQDIRDFTIV